MEHSSFTPLGLLPLRQNGELGIHVLQEIAFSPVREEMRGLFIHTELDPHPPQFFLALVCYHVHTGSSIKHQARCEGMWQLWPRYSWGPHPRVTTTLVAQHQSISKLTWISPIYYHGTITCNLCTTVCVCRTIYVCQITSGCSNYIYFVKNYVHVCILCDICHWLYWFVAKKICIGKVHFSV